MEGWGRGGVGGWLAKTDVSTETADELLSNFLSMERFPEEF